eukprot:scaffold8400_cov95-Cylindrotheca_fusiformis.AAC.3
MKILLSVMLVLLETLGAESQSLSLRQRGESQENMGPVGSNKPQTNAVKPMSSSQLVNAARTKINVFEDVTTPPSRRSLSTSSWEEVASFDLLEDSSFGGFRVSMSGDGTFLASSPYLSSNNGKDKNGIVRFFQKHESDGMWEEMINLRLTGDSDLEYFGSDVSLSENGQRVAIGALDDGANDDAMNSGSASVYELKSDGSEWVPLEVIRGENAYDLFGWSVALSKDGSTLAVGAPGNDDNGESSGHVRVYQLDAGTSPFNQLGKSIEGKAASDSLGSSVALSKDGLIVAIGAPYTKNAKGDSDVGQVRVFYWNKDEANATNSQWSQLGSDIVGNAANDVLGFSVDLSGDGNILAIGATNANYAQVFQLNDDEWEQIGETIYPPYSENPAVVTEYFGESVSLSTTSPSGSTILAVGSDETSFTYKLGNDHGWELMPGVLPGGAEVSLSSDGKTIAVANKFSNFNANEDDDGVAVAIYNLREGKNSGSNGDPHCKRLRTWNGGHFEYHGQCDMILIKDEEFANGLGLEVQIRTKLVRFWSFIQNAAIRIGDDTLEMQGSPDLFVNKDNNHYWINSVYQGQVTSLGGFPVKVKYAGKNKKKRWFYSKYGGKNKVSRSFEVDLSSMYPGQKIVIGSFKEFVRVDFQNAQSDAFGTSVGMLGDFLTGKLLARDGTTELKDSTKLGHEWQVLPQESMMLFHNESHPQFPQKCIEPEARAMKRRQRRLGESSITDEQAEVACAAILDVLDRKDCVYDILVTQDLTMVGAY